MSGLDLSWLTTASSANLSLLKALLAAMKRLHDAKDKTVEWHDALDIVTRAIEGRAKPDALTDAEWNALVDEWGRLQVVLRDHLPDALRPLTFKLSDIVGASFGKDGTKPVPGLLSFPLQASTALPAGTVAGGVAVTASAEADASATIQVSAAVPDGTPSDYTLPSAEVLVAFGINGALKAAAGATFKPAWGSVSVGANASATAIFHDVFNFPPSRYLADVLWSSFQSVYAPADLDGAFGVSSDYAFRLVELTGGLHFNGSLDVGVAVVGQLVGSQPTWAAVELGKPATATVGATASVGFGWGLDADFRVVTRRIAGSNGGVLVRIERSTARTTAASLSLSATIDIDGLQAMLDPLMAQVFPTAQSLIGKLGDLSDLRGLARQTIIERLGLGGSSTWDTIAQKLVDVAVGGNATADAKAIGDVVGQRFDDLAKARLADATAGLSAHLDGVKSAVAAVLPAGTAITNELDTLLQDIANDFTGRIEKAWADFAARLEKMADAAVTSAVDSAASTAIAQVLATPGAQVGAFIASLQAREKAVVAPLVTWLNAYEGARKKVAAVVAQIEREKLAISWAATFRETQGSTKLVEVLIGTSTPASQALYRAMCIGRLEDYPDLLAACVSENSAVERNSLLGASRTRERTANFTLDAFGFTSITSTATQLDQVAVTADKTGRIVAASDKIALNERMSVRGKVSEASLTIGLQTLAQSGGVPTLSSVFSASGAELSTQDSQNFFAMLEGSNAVTPGTGTRVHDLLFTSSMTQAATLAQAELSAVYSPDAALWPKLLALEAVAVEAATRTQCLLLLDLAIRTGGERGVEGQPVEWVARWQRDARLSDGDFWTLVTRSPNWSTLYERLVTKSGSDAPTTFMGSMTPDQRAVRVLWVLARIGNGVGQAWAGVADAQKLLQQLAVDPTALTLRQALAQLADLSDRITVGFTAAFSNEIPDLSDPTKVSWQTLGPILALASLASGDDVPPLLTKVVATVAGKNIAQLIV